MGCSCGRGQWLEVDMWCHAKGLDSGVWGPGLLDHELGLDPQPPHLS